MKVRAIVTTLFTCVAIALTAHHASAQATTAALHGTVTDPAGAVIPNADITVLNTSTGISTKTKSDNGGYFKFNQLQIGGPYTVTVESQGFSSFAAKGIQLNVNDDREVAAKLSIGSTAQTVEVTVASAQVETSETQLKTDLLSDTITQMPLLGRDATTLQKSAPGVVEAADRFGGFSANGAQIEQNSYLLDGADVNDSAIQVEGVAVNPDAVGELAIVTSTINPEYSRNSGAIINQALKTGTNSFHGNGFEFYRDTFLNTRSFFDPVGSKPPIHQNIYGGTLGGPIFKNKLFFFTAYQGAKSGLATTTPATVFSNAQRNGDFSADINSATGLPNSQIQIGGVNGLSGNPMPFALAGCAAGTPWNACPGLLTANVPTSSWNSLASGLFNKYVPAPNSGSLYNFAAGGSTKSDQGIIRLDYHLTPNDTFWSSVLFQSTPFSSDLPFGGSTLPGFAMNNAEHFKIFNADYTHVFNSRMINDLRGGYFRFNYASVEPAQIVQPSSVGFNITPQASGAGLPVIAVGGYFNLGFSYEGPQPRLDSNLLGQDIFTWVHGKHSVKIGATFEQFGVDNPYNADNDGLYTMTGAGEFSSGDPAIDFVLGIPDTFTQTSGSTIAATSREYYAFAQDSWKVTSDFNLNYGMSWDAETPWANHQFGGIAITCWQNSNASSKVFPGAPPGLLYPGDPGCTNYGAATVKWNHFGPRVGFVWSPSAGPSALIGNSSGHALAIRGGFGVYFNRDQEEEALQNLSSPPFLYQSRGAGDVGGSPSLADPFTDVAGRPGASITNPFPYQRPQPGATLDWANNYATLDLSQPGKNYLPSYTYNFNLNVQRAIGNKMVAQVGYVGSLGRKLARTYEGDPITPQGHDACLADAGCTAAIAQVHLFYPQFTAQPAIVPGSTAVLPNGIPWYLSVAQQGSTGASSYHSLQASVQQQVSHGLYFTLSYTYSHALDNSSGYESSYGNGTPNGSGALNGRGVNFTPGFEYLNYGNSDYDARHRFVALYTYEVPVLASIRDNFILNELLGKWHVAGTTALQTGFPVTISQAGAYRSGWCDAYTYYGCGDTPNLSDFHIKRLDPRNGDDANDNGFFDTSNFSPAPVGTFGNVGRNFFHGPGYNYSNLQIFKDFPLVKDGHVYAQLRLESYNVFNHTNFAQPDGNFADFKTFGKIKGVIQPANFGVSSGDPQPGRATQLSGKIYF